VAGKAETLISRLWAVIHTNLIKYNPLSAFNVVEHLTLHNVPRKYYVFIGMDKPG
jgi:hypothetical protein